MYCYNNNKKTGVTTGIFLQRQQLRSTIVSMLALMINRTQRILIPCLTEQNKPRILVRDTFVIISQKKKKAKEIRPCSELLWHFH